MELLVVDGRQALCLRAAEETDEAGLASIMMRPKEMSIIAFTTNHRRRFRSGGLKDALLKCATLGSGQLFLPVMTFQIKIKHWHAVAEWTWSEGDDDVCGICRWDGWHLQVGRHPAWEP